MDGKKEKGLERKAWAASQTTARMTFVDVMFWLGTRISYSLSVISSSDTLFSSRGTGHQWPPNTAKHITASPPGTVSPSIYLSIYPAIISLPSISIFYQCIYLCISNLYHLSLSAIYPPIHLSIISLFNYLHLLSMCLSTYLPMYLGIYHLSFTLCAYIFHSIFSVSFFPQIFLVQML